MAGTWTFEYFTTAVDLTEESFSPFTGRVFSTVSSILELFTFQLNLMEEKRNLMNWNEVYFRCRELDCSAPCRLNKCDQSCQRDFSVFKRR